MGTITSANAIVLLTIDLLFPTPVQLQGFATDDMFTTDAVEPAEVQMGADGYLVAGFVPRLKKMQFMFQASSPSVGVFEAWSAVNESQRQTLPANGEITLRATGAKYTLTNGYLTEYSPIPDAKRVLEPRKFGVTWQSITVGPTN